MLELHIWAGCVQAHAPKILSWCNATIGDKIRRKTRKAFKDISDAQNVGLGEGSIYIYINIYTITRKLSSVKQILMKLLSHRIIWVSPSFTLSFLWLPFFCGTGSRRVLAVAGDGAGNPRFAVTWRWAYHSIWRFHDVPIHTCMILDTGFSWIFMDFPAMFDETGASISAAVSIAMCELLEGTVQAI